MGISTDYGICFKSSGITVETWYWPLEILRISQEVSIDDKVEHGVNRNSGNKIRINTQNTPKEGEKHKECIEDNETMLRYVL